MWWDAAQIEATVTRQFVCSHLPPEEVRTLDRPLAFGGGLTDGTYWEWIDEKAKRLFLVLVDLNCPNQIFGLIDDSWGDDDLPIAIDQIGRLGLTATRDEKFDRRFYVRQFHYLIRYLEKGSHIVYQEDDVVPLSVPDRRPGLNLNHAVDKVELPNRPGEVLSRRRLQLGTGLGLFPYEEFLYEVNLTKNIQNDHILSYYGSYTHQGFGYVLFTPASDFDLKSLLVTMPAPVKSLDKQTRRNLLMNWIHCLVDTLCYIHSRGSSHGNIKPSSILFNSKNHVFYTDLTRLSGEALAHASDKSAFDKESYDYAAPEQWYRPPMTFAGSHRSSTHTPSSPENARFTIKRGQGESSTPARGPQGSTPRLDPQAADIFSLGCVILELLSLLLKRQTKAFAAHRAAKHKTPGRGGAVPDSSFHKNIGQVESWMAGLAKDASKKAKAKEKEEATRVFRGVAPTLQLVARMLSVAPHDRPTAREVERQIYAILTADCGIPEPHCVHQYGGWDFGLGGLRIGSSRPADGLDDGDGDVGESSYSIAAAPPPPKRPSIGSRSEPRGWLFGSSGRDPVRGQDRDRDRDRDRGTVLSYGGRSDPGPQAPQQRRSSHARSWQHETHPGVLLPTQSGVI
ncbi:hypothetical protein DL767_011546 [Monosporascus sp. MG133]|nr:hypothetical protein DL767_011546 [Monosporascus sp. MG133]